jgi:hypothetical protein
VFLGSVSVILANSRLRLVVLLVALLLLTTNAMTAQPNQPFLATAEKINEDLSPGDSIAFHRIEAGQVTGLPGFSVQNLYPYLETRDVIVSEYEDGDNVTYVISQFQQNYSGYVLVGTFHDKSESTVLKRCFEWAISTIIGREVQSRREPTVYLWRNLNR